MEKSAELWKQAESIVAHLNAGNTELFKTALDEAAGNMIRTVVREASLAENILGVKTVTPDTPGVQKYKEIDGFYYMEDIESNAIAMEASFRSEAEATFVDGKRYTIDIGLIKTEQSKKPENELLAVPNLIEMLKENGANSIVRIQDALFMSMLYRATTAGIWTFPHNIQGDWSSGFVGSDLVNLIGLITDQELKPHKWIGSETAWNSLLNVDASDVGDKAGVYFENGHEIKQLYGLPFAATIKGSLRGKIYTKYTGTGNITITQVGATLAYTVAGDEITTLCTTGQVVVGDQFYCSDLENGQVIAVGTASITVYQTDGLFDADSTKTLNWYIQNDGYYFDFNLVNGQKWTRVYQTVSREFLGKIIRMGTDKSWSKWEENIFFWSAGRDIGMGLGNIRGLSMISLRLT